jgi:hypothetical protein
MPMAGCAAREGDVERGVNGHHLRVVGGELLHQRHQSQTLPDIERVVAGRAVAAQPNGYTRALQQAHRRQPRRQLEIGLGTVGDADMPTVGAQQFDIFGQNPAAVGDQRRLVEDAGLRQHLDRRNAALRQARGSLRRIFGGVDVDADAQPPRLCDRGAQKVVVAGVGGVRRQPRADAPVRAALPAFHKGGGGVERSVALAGKDRPTKQGACARLAHRLRCRVHEKVVVGDGRHARLDHLDQPEQHPPIDILSGQITLHRPDEIVEPAVDGDILRQPAKEHHRCVGVRVDQPRRCQQSLRRHDVTGSKRLQRLCRQDRRNAVALNVDVVIGASGVHAVVAAHQYRTIVNTEIDWHTRHLLCSSGYVLEAGPRSSKCSRSSIVQCAVPSWYNIWVTAGVVRS